MRLQYQGIVPPVERDDTRFDPGAKYHVPAAVPYTRYFLARLLQFSFTRPPANRPGGPGRCIAARSLATRKWASG